MPTSPRLSNPTQPLPFWQAKKLEKLDAQEWEALCDGCGRCCLLKLEDDETGELSPLVARRKKFILYPMNEEEAIVQMRELGHDNFFVFYNAETSKVNVLYRRRNGSYGLIEPEVG